ncbi:MAG: TlpA family protein disulfide reductase [Bacteroidales bacterium]|nr:TlpA family protein disulfide reductase [Bacteroidales bacterium]
MKPKKFLCFAAMLHFAIAANADYTVSVKGRVEAFSEGDPVVAMQRIGRQSNIIASTEVDASGCFALQLTVEKPGIVDVLYDRKQSFSIWVEDEDATVIFPGYDKNSGPYMITPHYVPMESGEKNALMNEIAFIEYLQSKNMYKISEEIYAMKSLTDAQRDSLTKALFYMNQNSAVEQKKHLVRTHQGVGSLIKLLPLLRATQDTVLLEKTLQSLEANYPEAVAEFRTESIIKEKYAKASEVGMQAPALTCLDLDGNKVELDFKGKVLIIDFWASWCGPCRAEIPSLKKIYEDFKDNPEVAFMSISIDDKKDKWLDAVAKEQMAWPQYQAPKAGEEAMDKYQFSGIPFIIAITPDGRIFKRNLRGEAVREAIVEALSQKDHKPANIAKPTPMTIF